LLRLRLRQPRKGKCGERGDHLLQQHRDWRGQRFDDMQVSVTLLDKSRVHVWKQLLHEVASGSIDSETDVVEFIAHARRRHYHYRIGEMIGLDRAKRQADVAPTHDEDGLQIVRPRVLGYDTLVMAVGSLSNDFGTPGVA
jgi:NADH dehydrogenase